jgi:hypothetical protein
MASKKKTGKPAPRREDRPGHLDPKYAASLRAHSGPPEIQDDRAFIRGARTTDDLAEELAEEAVVAMTTGEDALGDDLQANVDEERGGPFVRSTGGQEYGDGFDASNPRGTKREPFPKT